MNKLIILGVILVLAISVFVVTARIQSIYAAPCKPCQTWGAIKTCADPDPDKRLPCCDCGKNVEVINQDF